MAATAVKRIGKTARRTAIRVLVRTWPLPWVVRALPERDQRLVAEMWTIRRARLFDASWYLQRYPDVAASGLGALEHFCRYGWRRGRDPGPHFSTSLYLAEHPDAAREGNPLVHFARHRTMAEPAAAPPPAPLPDEPVSPWYDAVTPQLSVVVLNFNRAALTLACVRSLLRHTETLRFEIVVVDNGSEADEFAQLARCRLSFRLIRLQRNVYFGEGNNLGVEAARAPLLCLMNNDAMVTPGWLAPMLRILHGQPDCGAVGPKFLYPDGRIQEAGALIDATGDARRLGHGASADDPAFAEPRCVDYVSAAAVLLSKSDFERVGGFDPCWDPAYYEDADLCLKLAVLGRRTWVCPDAAIVHQESVTTSDSRTALNIEVLKQINRGIFVERWGTWLASRTEGSGLPDAAAAVQARAGPMPCSAAAISCRRLLLVAAEPLLPDSRTRRLLAFAEALRESHIACIVTPERSSRIRVNAISDALGLQLGAFETAAPDDVGRMGNFETAVVCSGDALPPVPAPARHASLLCLDAALPADSEQARRGRWWQGYAVLLVGSEAARDRLGADAAGLTLPLPPIEVLPPTIAPVPGADPEGNLRSSGNRVVILNIAAFRAAAPGPQGPLIAALRELRARSGIDATLHLAGTLAADADDRDFLMRCRQAAEGLPVVFHVNASRDRLCHLYRRAAVYWHDAGPAGEKSVARRGGTVALLEAMTAGCLCFGSGSKDFHLRDGSTGCIVAGAAELAVRTARLLDPGAARMRLEMRRLAATHAGLCAAAALQPHYRRIAIPAAASCADLVYG